MFTRIANLIFATLALLVTAMSELGCRWAGSPPSRPHGQSTFREILVDLIALCWITGAVGLFYRKRVAWICSLIGVAASACGSATALATFLWLSVKPDTTTTWLILASEDIPPRYLRLL